MFKGGRMKYFIINHEGSHIFSAQYEPEDELFYAGYIGKTFLTSNDMFTDVWCSINRILVIENDHN